MELPEIPDFPRAALVPPRRTDLPFAVLTEDRREASKLLELAEQYGPRLLVPEVWSRILPRCGVLISSALSGGTFLQRVEDAVRCYPRRCWLLVEPMSMEFPLPCPSGTGTAVPMEPFQRQFFSEDLCCQYTHFLRNQQGVMVLWDTAESLSRKMELAKAAGFLGYVYPA